MFDACGFILFKLHVGKSTYPGQGDPRDSGSRPMILNHGTPPPDLLEGAMKYEEVNEVLGDK